jgi:hypothetical protein
MAIQSIICTQTEETKQISEFEITFKQINYAQVLNIVTSADGRATSYTSPEKIIGMAK